MTTRYYIEYEDNPSEWFCDHLETPTPETLAEAAELLLYVKAEFSLSENFRVTSSSAPYGVTCDVTDHVDAFIDARNEEAAREAAEDEAHERSERHSWEKL